MSSKHEVRIASIGGGTGLSCLLSGLKNLSLRPTPTLARSLELNRQNIHAIVTVSDDGGSSGRLRRELNVLPPGDLRNCLVALAKDELLMTRLFRYRFRGSGNLSGHSFGNLFLTALSDITGDLLHALELTSEVLAIQGKIHPATTQIVQLCAELEGGKLVRGETQISKSSFPIRRVFLEPADCPAVPAALAAIAEADVLTFGPGSLFTSVIPCLLVPGILEAVKSSSALKVFISNIMTQPGETTGMTASQHIRAFLEHAPGCPLDAIVLNRSVFSRRSLAKYRKENSRPVVIDRAALQQFGARLVQRNFAREANFVRHDPDRLARTVLELFCSIRKVVLRKRH